jgi:hypothetical protein
MLRTSAEHLDICRNSQTIFCKVQSTEISFVEGVGLGLAIQASFMLLLDYLAEARGKIYLDYLQSIN